MVEGDVKQVTALLQKYLSKFHLRPVMGEEEVKHWFLPQENIIDTFVVEVAAGNIHKDLQNRRGLFTV